VDGAVVEGAVVDGTVVEGARLDGIVVEGVKVDGVVDGAAVGVGGYIQAHQYQLPAIGLVDEKLP